MQYFLKIGFGELTDSYGSTSVSPNSGLGQGSGASQPGFLALSSLIINTHQCMGHGAKIQLSYALRLFHLTTIIYVDNTNLLHWPELSTTEPDKLVAHVHRATTDYGCLAQASGGILKEKTCSMYFFDYKFVHGRAVMKSPQDLPAPWCYIANEEIMLPLHITIPQLVSPAISIITHDVTTVSKMLGVYFSLAGNSAMHVEHMVQRGLEWVDCLCMTPVSRKDAWLSFYLQLYPRIS
jgi:hypothetical protein